MATRRRTNGEGGDYQTKNGRLRAALDLGWGRGKRLRAYLTGWRTARHDEGAGR